MRSKLNETDVTNGVEKVLSMLPKKLQGKTQLSSLNSLLTSNDPKKHALALINIKSGVTEGIIDDGDKISLLNLAIKSDAFTIVEVLITKIKSFFFTLGGCNESIELAMRSSRVSELLALFNQRSKLDFDACCKSLPWDMSDHHLVIVMNTLLLLTKQTIESAVKIILDGSSINNFDLVKLVLRCRSELDKESINFNILLSRPSVFYDTSLLALLIKEGADIESYMNNRENHPLHLTCRLKNVSAVRLLLQFNADVNRTDECGRTPLTASLSVGLIGEETTKLIIQRIACLTTAGKIVNANVLSIIRSDSKMRRFYESYVDELDKMKAIDVADGVSCYLFFSKTSHEILPLMRNMEVFKQLKNNILRLDTRLFPTFKMDVVRKFGVIRHLSDIVVSREQELGEIFTFLPSLVMQKITQYSLNLKNLEKEYYLNKIL